MEVLNTQLRKFYSIWPVQENIISKVHRGLRPWQQPFSERRWGGALWFMRLSLRTDPTRPRPPPAPQPPRRPHICALINEEIRDNFFSNTYLSIAQCCRKLEAADGNNVTSIIQSSSRDLFRRMSVVHLPTEYLRRTYIICMSGTCWDNSMVWKYSNEKQYTRCRVITENSRFLTDRVSISIKLVVRVVAWNIIALYPWVSFEVKTIV